MQYPSRRLPANIEAFMIELDRLSETHGVKTDGKEWWFDISDTSLTLRLVSVSSIPDPGPLSLSDLNEMKLKRIEPLTDVTDIDDVPEWIKIYSAQSIRTSDNQ